MTHDRSDDDLGELPERSVDDILRLSDFEEVARARMDPAAYAYYAGGAADESTLADNVAAFARLRLRPRVLRDVSHVDASTTLLGRRVPWPFGLAPNAAQVLAHPDGECATAKAAASAGIVMCVSTFSNKPIEDVAAAAPDGHRWFQLYVHQERDLAEQMIRRAVAVGYEAIVVTVDLPVAGYRERELRQPYRWSEETAFGNLGASTKGKEILELLGGLVNAALTWDDLSWIREVAGLPVVVKGSSPARTPRSRSSTVRQGSGCPITAGDSSTGSRRPSTSSTRWSRRCRVAPRSISTAASGEAPMS